MFCHCCFFVHRCSPFLLSSLRTKARNIAIVMFWKAIWSQMFLSPFGTFYNAWESSASFLKNQSIFACHDNTKKHTQIFKHKRPDSEQCFWQLLPCFCKYFSLLNFNKERECLDMTSKLVWVNYWVLCGGGKISGKLKADVKTSCANWKRQKLCVNYQLGTERTLPPNISFHHKKMNMYTFKFGYAPLM